MTRYRWSKDCFSLLGADNLPPRGELDVGGVEERKGPAEVLVGAIVAFLELNVNVIVLGGGVVEGIIWWAQSEKGGNLIGIRLCLAEIRKNTQHLSNL